MSRRSAGPLAMSCVLDVDLLESFVPRPVVLFAWDTEKPRRAQLGSIYGLVLESRYFGSSFYILLRRRKHSALSSSAGCCTPGCSSCSGRRRFARPLGGGRVVSPPVGFSLARPARPLPSADPDRASSSRQTGQAVSPGGVATNRSSRPHRAQASHGGGATGARLPQPRALRPQPATCSLLQVAGDGAGLGWASGARGGQGFGFVTGARLLPSAGQTTACFGAGLGAESRGGSLLTGLASRPPVRLSSPPFFLSL
jgi:hypothetical protein